MIGEVLLDAAAIILVLLVVVLVHEGGHFVLAKLSGIRVDEFAVGFGPRLFSRRLGETTYAVRAIPAGGFVRMAGMLGLEGEADAGERNFYRASIPKRMATILAGIVANLLLAGLLFAVYFSLGTGSQLVAGEAAQAAGLHDGDSIVSVDGRVIRHDTSADVSDDLHAATAASNGRPLSVVYTDSSGNRHTVSIKPSLVVNIDPAVARSSPTPAAPAATAPPAGTLVVTAINGQPVGTGDPAQLLGGSGSATVSGFLINADGTQGRSYQAVALADVTDGDGADQYGQAAWRLGVAPDFAGKPPLQALSDGFGQIPTFVTDTATGLYDLITQPKLGGITGPQGLSGPVGIAKATVTYAHRGGRSLLYWIAFISMNLALVNVLPIPFLDGGKFFLIVLEAIRRRRLDPRHEAFIYAVGLALVLVFAIYVTIGDVTRPQ